MESRKPNLEITLTRGIRNAEPINKAPKLGETSSVSTEPMMKCWLEEEVDDIVFAEKPLLDKLNQLSASRNGNREEVESRNVVSRLSRA